MQALHLGHSFNALHVDVLDILICLRPIIVRLEVCVIRIRKGGQHFCACR